MAKQQNLSLNPSKLSGMCGRLKCCLRYELPNGKGVKHGGCADEGGCGTCSNPTGPGGGGGGGGGCGSCGPGGCGEGGGPPVPVSASPLGTRPALVPEPRARWRPTRRLRPVVKSS